MDRIARLEHRSTDILVDNETKSTSTRITVDGRTITYTMTVLQQPQRARACGQGAKSSADRRPVDPPPIVELKIFQGEKAEEDITFTMHANYFLFATLENARSMAHGRVPQDRQTPPVLTGTPVAGMVYLDRPSPAGYFIFPDLSVRHEGRYRLSFSLYEELKQPKDFDKTEDVSSNPAGDNPHVTHRLEVKSEPFHVYSAKKFPGLSESTSLSRMVAEQGCRVRIRRDVRMRRRDHKSDGKDWEDYEDETAAARARASNTPDPNMYPVMQTSHGFREPVPRPRSASNASHHSVGTSISRRPSLQEMGQAYNQPSSHYGGTAPHTPQNGYAQTSYGPSTGQQYQQNQYAQPQAPMQPPPPQYQHQSYADPPSVQAPAPTNYYNNYQPAPAPVNHRYSNGGYEPVSQAPRQSIDYSNTDYRRSSTTQHTPPPAPAPQVGYAQQATHAYQPPTYPAPPPSQASSQHSQHSQHSYSSMQPYANRPAPLEPMHPPAQSAGVSTPSQPSARWDLPPLNTTLGLGEKIEASSPSSTGPPNSYYGNTQTPHDTHKRSYGNVFSDRHQNGPLRQGARPNNYNHADSITSIPSLSAVDDDDNTGGELDPSSMGMQYRRADGREIQRALPGHAQ